MALINQSIYQEEEKIRESLQEKTKYKEVAPTWELNIEKYGTFQQKCIR